MDNEDISSFYLFLLSDFLAYIKNYVARMYHPGRSHKDLRRQILAGMYGGPGRNGQVHEGLTAELAAKLIAHTHTHINKFILETQDKHTLVGRVGCGWRLSCCVLWW